MQGRGAARAESRDERHSQAAAGREAVLAHRAGPHRRHAERAGRADRQRPGGRDSKTIEADGRVNDVDFDYTPERSSWVALRDLPRGPHEPDLRRSRRQADPREPPQRPVVPGAVDRCWESKSPAIRESERAAARAAYDHARERYRQIEAESFDDGEL